MLWLKLPDQGGFPVLGKKAYADLILVPGGTMKTRCAAPALASFGSITRSASIPEVLIS